MYCQSLEEFAEKNPHLKVDQSSGIGAIRWVKRDEYKKGITDEEDFTRSDYKKLFDILIKFYTKKQINEIWGLLKKYDKTIKIK
tara:strand:+ start:145 stop:396 length:252 start_codon:yes stop_codon:yes gene_type:complete